MLKIDKGWEGPDCIFLLSGRIQAEDAAELHQLIRTEKEKVVLDLKEIKLVDRAAVKFLAQCETEGIEIRNASLYIREWISRETAGQKQEG
jgi:anti-anti-sigma regulatory factor